jgi:cell division protein FtsL
MVKKILIYFMVLTIPLSLGAVVYQSNRYTSLKAEIARMSALQEQYIRENKRLATEIALLSSSERIQEIARADLGMELKKPEEITQIIVEQR